MVLEVQEVLKLQEELEVLLMPRQESMAKMALWATADLVVLIFAHPFHMEEVEEVAITAEVAAVPIVLPVELRMRAQAVANHSHQPEQHVQEELTRVMALFLLQPQLLLQQLSLQLQPLFVTELNLV